VRSTTERDDVIYQLNKILVEFYGKELDYHRTQVWLEALRGFTASDIETALKRHVQVGRFSPTPAEIINHLNELNAKKRNHAEPETQPYTPCIKRINDAWVTFLREVNDFELPSSPASSMPFEEAVIICNQEAKRCNEPDAIPDEYKIPDIWEGVAA
jgi:hypothetical protein